MVGLDVAFDLVVAIVVGLDVAFDLVVAIVVGLDVVTEDLVDVCEVRTSCVSGVAVNAG